MAVLTPPGPAGLQDEIPAVVQLLANAAIDREERCSSNPGRAGRRIIDAELKFPILADVRMKRPTHLAIEPQILGHEVRIAQHQDFPREIDVRKSRMSRKEFV